MSISGHQYAGQGRPILHGALAPSAATEEVKCNQVDQVHYDINLSGGSGFTSATFRLEGRIRPDDNNGNSFWFNLDVDGTFSEDGTFHLFYGNCRSLLGIRCRFVVAVDGPPTCNVAAMPGVLA